MRTLLVALLLSALAMPARADNASRDAAKHFQRGVDLYNDGDFRGALVEFKKAYATWPRANVLYDIGQTEYQLLDYASALKTMERYLSETGANAPHRSDVENSVEILRGRVGHVDLTTEGGCEVTVDDQPAGNTPLDTPLLVSVGSRKLAVTCPGGRSVNKRVEVAAGDTLRVELHPPAPPIAAVRAAMNGTPRERKPSVPSKAFIPSWVVTGVLVAGTIGLGAASLVEQSRLSTMRDTYPTTRDALNAQTSLTSGLAISTDVLGAASLVAIGVSTYLTIKYQRDVKEHNKRVRAEAAPRGVQVGFNF
jgi:hypothetical protein